MSNHNCDADPIDVQIRLALHEQDIARARELVIANPEQATATFVDETWLHRAAELGDIDLMELLCSLGADPNVLKNGPSGPPLSAAIRCSAVEAAKWLLLHGADANSDRSLIGAINRNDQQTGLQITKLLVDHGADVNRVFPWFDNPNHLHTPLSWAIATGKHEIAEYLRSQGAVMPPGQSDPGPPTLDEEIVAHFASKLGPVLPLSLQEIVPTGLPISIHVIPPSEGRSHITLFTTGMSQQRMTAPAGVEALQYAELALNLPADWPLPGMSQQRSLFSWLKRTNEPGEAALRRSLWPIQWLRTIARYPHESGMLLGGAALIFSNGDPPEPLAAGVPFTSFLLMNIDQVPCAGGKQVHIYQLLPLYTAERQLELDHDLPTLLQALDNHNIPWVVDLNRPNVAVS